MPNIRNWWRHAGTRAGGLSMSPKKLAVETLLSANSSANWALQGRPRKRPSNLWATLRESQRNALTDPWVATGSKNGTWSPPGRLRERVWYCEIWNTPGYTTQDTWPQDTPLTASLCKSCFWESLLGPFIDKGVNLMIPPYKICGRLFPNAAVRPNMSSGYKVNDGCASTWDCVPGNTDDASDTT